MRKLTEFTKTDNGLLITLTDEGRRDLADDVLEIDENGRVAIRSDLSHVRVFYEFIEYQLGNGWDSLDAFEIGALWGGEIILSDTAEVDDYGDLVSVKSVYTYTNYAIRSELMDLVEYGVVELTRFDSEEE